MILVKEVLKDLKLQQDERESIFIVDKRLAGEKQKIAGNDFLTKEHRSYY